MKRFLSKPTILCLVRWHPPLEYGQLSTHRGLTCLLSGQINVSLTGAFDWTTLTPPTCVAFIAARNENTSLDITTNLTGVFKVTNELNNKATFNIINKENENDYRLC